MPRRVHPRALLRQVSRAARSWSKNYSDEKLQKLRRGGHDPEKVYAAYKAAVERKGQPTVILAKTIKGYGLGEARRRPQHHPPAEEAERRGAARVPHAASAFRSPTRTSPRRRSISRPTTAPEMQYLHERAARRWAAPCPAAHRRAVRKRSAAARRLPGVPGRQQRQARCPTTMAFVRLLDKLLPRQEDRQVHRADRARRIAHLRHGRPVPPDRHLLARRPALRAGRFRPCSPYYKEAKDGQIAGRRHHRGRLDVVVHRRRHGLLARTA